MSRTCLQACQILALWKESHLWPSSTHVSVAYITKEKETGSNVC